MDRRSYTRLIGVQALYSASFLDEDFNSLSVLSDTLELQESANSKFVKSYDEKMINLFLDKFKNEKNFIDSIIEKFIDSDWSIQRMDLMLLSIIRASICELLYSLDVPTVVILNEYVNLSSLFLNIEEINFVNAILCSIAKSIRKDELYGKKIRSEDKE